MDQFDQLLRAALAGTRMKRTVAGLSAAAMAGLGMAACSSSPSSTTGSEVLNGSTANVTSSAIPITAHGVSDTHGAVQTSGPGSKGTLHFADGTVNVDHTAGKGPTHVNKAACSATSVMNGTYKITGGTGKYKGATGHGAFTLTFAGTFSHNGKCNLSASASPSSGMLSFHASGTWTVKS